MNNFLNECFCKKNCVPCCISGITGPVGPTGATGATGISETIQIGQTITLDSGMQAFVTDEKNGITHILTFAIPKGLTGATGATGPAGTSVEILGSYETYEDLKQNKPQGNVGDSYLVDTDLYVWSDTDKNWENAGTIKGPKGDTGPMGATGATGPTLIRTSYLVTFNDGTAAYGISVPAGDRIPIDRNELDVSNLVTIDNEQNTIKFNTAGYYKVTIILSVYSKATSAVFETNRDFVSIGLRLIGTDNIYIGASKWIYNEEVTQLVAQGVLAVDNPKNLYELVNLGKEALHLHSPDLKDIASISYFTTPLVNVLVEYLGRGE